MVSVVQLIVLITTILIGGLTRPLLSLLKIKTTEDSESQDALASNGDSTPRDTEEVNESKMWFSKLDNKYFKVITVYANTLVAAS